MADLSALDAVLQRNSNQEFWSQLAASLAQRHARVVRLAVEAADAEGGDAREALGQLLEQFDEDARRVTARRAVYTKQSSAVTTLADALRQLGGLTDKVGT